MANIRTILPRKAGYSVCLFLLSFLPGYATDNLWEFEPQLEKAHNLILNLQTTDAYAILNDRNLKVNELQRIYLLSLCETVDILITEDDSKFASMETNFRERLNTIDQLSAGPEKLFLQAELNLQRGFNYLNLGQEINAVLSVRRAYNATQDCLKRYPQFIPIRKTSGVIQVMVGAVPDKYRWFMSLLGMKGSIAVGQSQLEELRQSKCSLHHEATLLYYSVKGFINQQFEEASTGILESLKTQSDNRLLLFLGINMLMKDSHAEEALALMHNLDKHTAGLQMEYVEYLRAEALLQKGSYADAIMSYQHFIRNFRSQNYKKDSFYKTALCFWLLGNQEMAKLNFEQAKKTGKVVADPDKYAARQLEENNFPNAKILKVRFYTDGGYFKEASEALQTIKLADLTSLKDRTEYYYRKARLAHKTGELTAAKLFYEQSIDMTGENPWYFAPNSALQLGYIAQAQKDNVAARKYFEKAMTYKRHEYKSSIDSKAKSALEQLN